MDFRIKTDKPSVRKVAESFLHQYKDNAENLWPELVDKTFDIYDAESYKKDYGNTIDNDSPAQFVSKDKKVDLDNDSIIIVEELLGEFSNNQSYALIAHELGHFVHDNNDSIVDTEIKADSSAHDLGLGNFMIEAIEIMKKCQKNNAISMFTYLQGLKESNENAIKDFEKRISALQDLQNNKK